MKPHSPQVPESAPGPIHDQSQRREREQELEQKQEPSSTSISKSNGPDDSAPSESCKETTKSESHLFDFSAFPKNTLFYERRTQAPPPPPAEDSEETEEEQPSSSSSKSVEERRPSAKKERRKRVDPCTFEKQYTPDETEFMNAMQKFKSQTGKAFPTHDDVLKIAWELGYRKVGKPTALPGCRDMASSALTQVDNE